MSNRELWVLARANELTRSKGCFDALCDLITEHEEPPVDPLLIEARKISAEQSREDGQAEQAGEYLAGKWDDGASMRKVLKALRRGMELAREERP